MEHIQVLKDLLKVSIESDDEGIKSDLLPKEIDAIKWAIEQIEMVEILEKRLENALFTDTHFEPVPKRTFPIEMKVSFGGKLPVAPERD